MSYMTKRLPVVVRVKRKRELAPLETVLVEAEESHAAKRRARDTALAAELDAALTGAFGRSPGDAAESDGSGQGQASEPAATDAERPIRRRFRRVRMTLSVADVQDIGRVQELVHTVMGTSRKRGQTEAGIEAEAAAASASISGPKMSSSTLEKDFREDVFLSRSHPTKRMPRLARAPTASASGADGTTHDGTADAMHSYFRVYDLVCSEQEEGVERNEMRRETSAVQKRAGGGLRRGGQPPQEVSTNRGDGQGKNLEDAIGEEKMEALMCNYMPMVREYLGSSNTVSDQGHDQASDGSDAYVYDVYVEDEDFIDTADDKDDKQRTNVIYVGGQDTELFFDAMDGLVDDDDDVDSQDSNREDAPCADYPDEEEEWDGADESDSDGSCNLRRMEMLYGGGQRHDGYDSYDELEGAGFTYQRDISSGYRETAYDPEYDDVTNENYYS